MVKQLLSAIVSKVSRWATNGGPSVQRLTAFALDMIDDRRVIKTRHGSFTIRVANPIERWRADTLVSKEPETIEWLERTLSSQSVFYDVGANVGVYTLYAGHMFGGDIDIVCFEPEALNFARLNRNIFDNAFSPRTLSFCMGLGKQRSLASFQLSAIGAGRALHGERHVAAQTEMHRQGIVVDGLDSVLLSIPALPRPTHLKIDVDGPEIEILEGATETLRSPDLKHILIELMDSEIEAARSLLAPHGFKEIARGESFDGMANHIFEKQTESTAG